MTNSEARPVHGPRLFRGPGTAEKSLTPACRAGFFAARMRGIFLLSVSFALVFVRAPLRDDQTFYTRAGNLFAALAGVVTIIGWLRTRTALRESLPLSKRAWPPSSTARSLMTKGSGS